ncbi:MAG: hypothetical protein E2603_09990, partial [Achromobacter sp.]|nr:hypothetical protein [Achromobacter sp.]
MTATTTPSRPATPAVEAGALSHAGPAGLWLACMAAMAAGLWIDTLRTPAALLASECAAPGSLAEMAWRHARLMPASSIAMPARPKKRGSAATPTLPSSQRLAATG